MVKATFETLYAQSKHDPVPLKRIRKFAQPFEVGFALLAGAAVLFFSVLLVLSYLPGGYVTFNDEGGWLTMDPSNAPVDALPVTAFSLKLQIVGTLTAIFTYGSLIAALWSLHKLFGAYRRGRVFASEPIQLMRRASFGLIAFAATPGLMQPLMRVLDSPDRNWFHGETITIIIAGAALFLFAHIIELGVELERENKRFV